MEYMKIANEMPRDTIAYMWDSQGRRMVLDTGNTLNFFRKYAYAENLDYYPWSSGYEDQVAPLGYCRKNQEYESDTGLAELV
ncbi:MAG: hypothetical protein R2941_09730 [Desulfobacterales bacterium]